MAQLLGSPVCAMRLSGILMLFLGSSLTLAEHDSPGLVGGLEGVPVSDPGVLEAVQFAVSAYNQRSNDLYYSRATKILKAQSQVVAGIKYYLTVELVNTVCEKRGDSLLSHVDLQRCAPQSGVTQQKQHCDFEVWSRPWLNDTQLTSMKCRPVSS